MATSTRLARNGIRQAHALNASGNDSAIAVIIPVPSSSPIGTPICGRLAISPRLFCLPHSMDSSTEPLHSPPTATPCSTRSTTSRMGAATPIVLVPGRTPTSAGDTHHQQRDDQRGLAANSVSPVAEDSRPDRPGREHDGVVGERLQGYRLGD